MTFVDIPYVARRRLSKIRIKPPPFTLALAVVLWPFALLTTYVCMHRPLTPELVYWPFFLLVAAACMALHYLGTYRENVRQRRNGPGFACNKHGELVALPAASLQPVNRALVWCVAFGITLFFTFYPHAIQF